MDALGPILLLYLILRRLVRNEINVLRAEVKRVEKSTEVRIQSLETSTIAKIENLEKSTETRIQSMEKSTIAKIENLEKSTITLNKSLERVVKENQKDTRAILNAIVGRTPSDDVSEFEVERGARVAANRAATVSARGKQVRSAESE